MRGSYRNIKFNRRSSAEMSTDRTRSGGIKTEAKFGQIKTGSDCNFFENWRIRTGSD